jgi:hypothetical protein
MCFARHPTKNTEQLIGDGNGGDGRGRDWACKGMFAQLYARIVVRCVETGARNRRPIVFGLTAILRRLSSTNVDSYSAV